MFKSPKLIVHGLVFAVVGGYLSQGFALSPLSAMITTSDVTIQALNKSDFWVGGAVGIYDNGLQAQKVYGVTEPNSGTAPSLDAYYEIGSISKSFTGILLAIALNEVPGLRADDPVGKFLPAVTNPYVAALTLEQLATHSAGLPDDPPYFMTADTANAVATFGENKLLEFLISIQPNPKLVDGNHPGKFLRSYSNLGFATLGLILTKIYGESFDALVLIKIARPLGMLHTFVDRPGYPLPPEFLKPFGIGKNLTAHFQADSYAPTGGIVSTLPDMMKYLKANSHCANDKLGAAIQLSHRLGFGWDSLPGEGIVFKNGQTFGFSSFIGMDPKHATGIVVLNNMYDIFSNWAGALSIETSGQFSLNSIYQFYTQAKFDNDIVSLPLAIQLGAAGHYVNSDDQGFNDITLERHGSLLLFVYQGVPRASVMMGVLEGKETVWLYTGSNSLGTITFESSASGETPGFTANLPGFGTYKFQRK